MTKKSGMGGRGAITAAKVNEALASEEAKLIRDSSSQLENLKPRVSDPAAYEKLIKAVAESTQCNESVAAFKERVSKLGEGVMKVAKEVYSFLK